jgi:hypothetical protein
VIVVRVVDLWAVLFNTGRLGLIKMRMNDGRMIVICSSALRGVNVLKRRQQESQHESQARL